MPLHTGLLQLLVPGSANKAQAVTQECRLQQIAHTDAAGPAYFVLIARANSPAGGADGIAVARFAQALFFQVIGENDVSMIAEREVGADGDAGFPQLINFFEKSRRGHTPP